MINNYEFITFLKYMPGVAKFPDIIKIIVTLTKPTLKTH